MARQTAGTVLDFDYATTIQAANQFPFFKGRGTSAGFVFWPISFMRGHWQV